MFRDYFGYQIHHFKQNIYLKSITLGIIKYKSSYSLVNELRNAIIRNKSPENEDSKKK